MTIPFSVPFLEETLIPPLHIPSTRLHREVNCLSSHLFLLSFFWLNQTLLISFKFSSFYFILINCLLISRLNIWGCGQRAVSTNSMLRPKTLFWHFHPPTHTQLHKLIMILISGSTPYTNQNSNNNKSNTYIRNSFIILSQMNQQTYLWHSTSLQISIC